MTVDANSHDASTSQSQQKEELKSKINQGKTKTVPFYKLLAFADYSDVLLMIVGAIGAVGNGISMPLMTILLGDLINSFGNNQNNKDVLDIVSKVCLKLVYLGLGTFVSAALQVACWTITGERQAARIRSLYLKTILRQDIVFFDLETTTGEIVERMSSDTFLIQDALGEKVGKFVQLISTFIGGFVIAFTKGWLLTLYISSSIPLIVITGAAVAILISKMASLRQKSYSNAASVADETIGSIRTVASFTGEEQSIRSYNKFLLSAYSCSVNEALASGFGVGVICLVLFCNYALAVWFGGKMILEKGYNGGMVLSIIVSVMIGSSSLGQVSPCLSSFAAGQAAAYKMFKTIQRKPIIDANDPHGKTLDAIHGDIELKDVCFRYLSRPDEQIFAGFSLFIPSGSTAALVGQSGSGKSTVISLIERFYDPQDGAVLIDGVDLKDLQLKWIRSKIGLVSQESVLFSASIKENIAYGKQNATMDEIKAAAELANAAKFIDKFPQGYETMVGQHGAQISGGQKQRIAIARAILKDPRILLLDEATSALDAISERVVQEALDRVMVSRTTVIVAHRLSTVRNADMIAVIHDGKLVEKGSHMELLMDPEGAYSQLIHLQDESKDSGHTETNSFEISSFRGSSKRESSFRRSISGSSEHSRRISMAKADNNQEEHVAEVSLRRLAALNKPEIPVLVLGTLVGMLNGVIFPIFGVLLSNVVKSYFKPPHELKSETRLWSIIFMVLGVVSLSANPTQSYLYSIAGNKLIQRIRSMCFEKMLRMEIGWFDEAEHSKGSLGSSLSADAAKIRALVGDALSLAVQNTATAASGILIAFASSWQLAFIILAIIPLLGINEFLKMKFSRGFSANAKVMYDEASQVASDAVGNIRTVGSFCAEEKVMEMYQKKCEGPMKTGIRLGIISGIGFGISFFMLFGVYATSFYAGVRLVVDGKITFDVVFRVFLVLTLAAIGVSQTSSLAPDSGKAKSAAASIFRIVDRKSKIDPREESGIVLENVKGDIQLRSISFRYPSRPDVQIFRDLSLSIHAGKTVALVGESGSGKSTLISLLQRFYDPDSGSITLDGIKIQELQLKWLRQQMGLVGQEPVLFNTTIRANIAYGKGGNATEAEIVAAAELANAHKFISSLKEGYNTTVGERGIQLSGGQKQRVAIARAIIKNPRILLLDEATSALDTESERVVQDALDRVMAHRTTLVVAHRLSTIKNADVIAAVKEGVIVEEGKHENLINMEGGIYASLVHLHMNASS